MLTLTSMMTFWRLFFGTEASHHNSQRKGKEDTDRNIRDERQVDVMNHWNEQEVVSQGVDDKKAIAPTSNLLV